MRTVYFVPLVTEKVVLVPESLFRPANCVRRTRLLVEIHNRRETDINVVVDVDQKEKVQFQILKKLKILYSHE